MLERLGSLLPDGLLSRLQRKLREADLPFLAEEYAGAVLALSVLFFLLLLPLSPVLALLVSLLLFSLLLYLPSYLSFVRARRAERELPFFLKSLSTLLKSGVDPLSSLEIASRGYPVLGSAIQKILSLRRSGVPLRRAFEEVAESFASERLKRSLLMVEQVISGGHGVEALDRYADSLLSSKRVEIKEFSNRLALYTLAFIALTALAPSILLMYTLLLPLVFKTAASPVLLLFVLFFLVPVLTLFLLGYVSSQVG
ncbi:MAG: type II secretion system F family protein [Candidatus Diapherotrites archaeon]|nr:type II secretion system F family protein [Candidatus Diapherotrites archaeon]